MSYVSASFFIWRYLVDEISIHVEEIQLHAEET